MYIKHQAWKSPSHVTEIGLRRASKVRRQASITIHSEKLNDVAPQSPRSAGQVCIIPLCSRHSYHGEIADASAIMSEYESPADGRGDQIDSPDEARASKRRRIALACLDCRRRKLKCDRAFPACTRCRKGGKTASCIYDPDALEAIVGPSAEQGNVNGGHIDGRYEAGSHVNRRNPGSPSSFIHHHALDRDESAVTALRAHIYRLETRLISLEKTINDPYQPHYPSRRGEFVPHSRQNASKDPDAKVAEAMMFRGKSFKTQFYGASHHTSQILHVDYAYYPLLVVY